MGVPRCNSETMIDNHQAAIAGMVFRNGNDSIRRRVNRSAIIRRHVYAGMKRAFTAEWVQALAEAVGNVSHHRPDRWGVRGIRKTHRGEQMQPAAGDGDHCSITLQEGVLLDGAVKSILSVGWIIALIECRRVI